MTNRPGILQKLTLTPLLFLLGLLLLLPHPTQALLLGDVDFRPTLRIDGVFDDNIFSRPQDSRLPIEEDFFTRIIPSVAFTYDRGPTDFYVRYQNEFLFYKNFPERDARGDNHGFDLGLGHTFGQRSSVSLDNTFRIGTDISSIAEGGAADPAQPGILPRGRKYRTNNLRIGGTHAITRRLDLMGDITYRYNWYGSTLEGDLGDDLRTEDHLESIFLTTAYSLTPAHALTGTLGFSHNDYDQLGKARYLTATVGYRGQVARPLTLEGSVGLQYLNEDSAPDSFFPRQESVWPRANLSATYVLYDLTVSAAGSVGLNDSSGYGGTAIQRQARVGLDYRPWQRLTLRAFGLYTKSDSTSDDPTANQDQESFQSGAGGSYRFASWVSARLDYTYIDQDSAGTVGGTYQDNRIVLGLTLSLPDTIR